ncbi:LacI family DNA-binding transcriptional regulator [Georgenia subflava]|uniref:Substrate-binding domain-containing protein n=1 Tax=Georgenia subflava TaxID=1622177 RepID=A0A6N7ELX2_9MICO|nr:LacI family DNA-binding transcriptional regulator [Georgenia subflava]MPV37136.1 substrate-binding domain-containing protein [Georgenia subflava]
MVTNRATLPQVAERAGVSLASASRALHGSGASVAMVERVKAAAAELGYQRDATGRSLRLGRTFQIGFAVADIGNPVYVEMMSAIQAVVAERGYRLVVATTGGTPESSVDLVRSLSGGLVDGLVISPLRLSPELVTEMREAAVPVVAIGRSLEADGIDSVSTDSAGGIGQAVAHTLAIGRRRIGFLNGPLETTPGEARQRGFDHAVAQDGFGAHTVDTQVAADFTVAAGLAAAHELLARHTAAPLDAVVAANDLLAIGAIKAASELGLRVPEDLAVTGMDDTEIGQVYQPSLTSVSLHSSERGRRAAELMLRLLDDPQSSPTTVFVEPELRVRESTRTEEQA